MSDKKQDKLDGLDPSLPQIKKDIPTSQESTQPKCCIPYDYINTKVLAEVIYKTNILSEFGCN